MDSRHTERTAPLRLITNPWSEARVRAGLSLRELERASGVNRGVLSMIDGGRYVPTPDQARRILRALDEGKR